MSMFGNTLFVRLRLVSDLNDSELHAAVHALFAETVGIHFIRSREDDGAQTYCALLSTSHPGLIEALRELLAAAKSRGANDGVRELVIEVGRAADLPQGVAVALQEYLSCSSAAIGSHSKVKRLQSCSSGLLMTFSLLAFDPTQMSAPPAICVHREERAAPPSHLASLGIDASCSLFLMSH